MDCGVDVPFVGIIPARAGFTAAYRRAPRVDPDHPRSRGVYVWSSNSGDLVPGSSPLARGLPVLRGLLYRIPGIIPARAGFTCPSLRSAPSRPDHPRSRGVYHEDHPYTLNRIGSSPLARGLLLYPFISRPRVGIIPARAGFTLYEQLGWLRDADHPRSRGVYPSRSPARMSRPGSSPLARGLRRTALVEVEHLGIIPARAGFTPRSPPTGRTRSDHPRSRGVYPALLPSGRRAGGSSPLARGLLPPGHRGGAGPGIIPARAGFTGAVWVGGAVVGDHPRSRGVYLDGGTDDDPLDGSSPLARGLPSPSSCTPPRGGIIPARAGFTGGGGCRACGHGDHPRSRGVYDWEDLSAPQQQGSSPLARGLRSWPQPRRTAPGIIPARAGFTPSCP